MKKDKPKKMTKRHPLEIPSTADRENELERTYEEWEDAFGDEPRRHRPQKQRDEER